MTLMETVTLPGFVDLHVHLREPSTNDSETIGNGSRAALLGGFALICDMPNNPGHPTWTEERLDEKIAIRNRDAYNLVRFHAGAQPEADNVGELAGMAKKAVGLKLYGSPNVSNYQPYKVSDFEDAVAEWHRVAPEKPVLFHLGENDPNEVIDLVARKHQHRLHVCHVNSPKEVEVVRVAADQDQLQVTCGVCPDHLFKTSHDTMSQGWFARRLPPLARQIDAEKLWSYLAAGKIDCIETDYAPHSRNAKWAAETANPEGHGHPHSTCYGVPGIEHVVSLLLRQVKLEHISMSRLLDAMSSKPLRILGAKKPPKTAFVWRMQDFRIESEDAEVESGAEWTPYLGMLGTGVLQHAIINGHTVIKDGKPKRVTGLNS